MVTTNSLGYDIYYDEPCSVWRFCDNNEIYEERSRPCALCGKHVTELGHDPCIANIPNAKNACCGHGDKQWCYVQLDTGLIEKESAFNWIKENTDKNIWFLDNKS